MSMRRGLTSGVAAAALALTSVAGALPALAAGPGQSGTTLTADVTATASNTLTYGWDITKSASPSVIDMFEGDTATTDYTVAVTRDNGTAAASLSGQVCVTNGGAVATEGLAITANVAVNPSTAVIASASVDLGAKAVLAAGESACYPYSIAITNPQVGKTYKVTSVITISNHSGSLGTPKGPSPSATITMPAQATVNASVDVVDSNGMSWTANGSDSWTYPATFTAAGTYPNTATITQTGQNASADVTVRTHKLSVAKTAGTSWDRNWTWSIDKSVAPTSLTLMPGQTSTPISWTVSVSPAKTDSGYTVAGTITVSNPAPMAATLTSVTDTFGDLAIDVSCPALTVPANGSLECTYSKALGAAVNGTNTATATLQNHAYASDGTATATGTTAYTGSADVAFSATPTTETDECVNVTDSLKGTLGTVCEGDATKSFTYTTTAGPYQYPGTYSVDNTASFTTNDTASSGSDTASVTVNVPSYGYGCTLTQGYWKTHSAVGPAPYDDLWASYQNKMFGLSGKTWYQVYWTPPAGNAYYNLAHQYMAASMNVANGASTTPAVTAALASADAFFATASPSSTLTKAQKASLTTWAATLASYNEGLTGPGHCSQ